MTRRDRAALVLAYELVRGGKRDFPWAALAALRAAQSDFARTLADAVDDADYPDDCWGPGCGPRRRRFSRVLRARLALLLRVLLRAEAGDYGPRRCVECERSAMIWHGHRGSTRRYVPAWEVGR